MVNLRKFNAKPKNPKILGEVKSEHSEQAAYATWLSFSYPEVFGFAVPNDAKRSVEVARRKKAEGLKAGIPDFYLEEARGGYFGLRIEFKRIGEQRKVNGGLSEAQVYARSVLRARGYKVDTAYGFLHAQEITIAYMALPMTVGLPGGLA